MGDDRRQLLRAAIETAAWSGPFLREMELTVAANVVESNQTRQTLYEDVLASRVAARCQPLDAGYREEYLGIITVPQMTDQWKRIPEALRTVIEKPRGAWAILEMDGGYDVYMSNGIGGYGTPTGHKFTKISPTAPDLTADTGYASCLSYMVYEERKRIESRLDDESLDRIAIAPGRSFSDIYMSGKTWSRVTFLKEKTNEAGRAVIHLERARRGVKTQRIETGRSFKQALVPERYLLPPDLMDEANPRRLKTLAEKRAAAAQAAYDALAPRIAEKTPLSTFASRSSFRAAGADVMARDTYRGEFPATTRSGEISVVFIAGTDDVLSATWTPEEERLVA